MKVTQVLYLLSIFIIMSGCTDNQQCSNKLKTLGLEDTSGKEKKMTPHYIEKYKAIAADIFVIVTPFNENIYQSKLSSRKLATSELVEF